MLSLRAIHNHGRWVCISSLEWHVWAHETFEMEEDIALQVNLSNQGETDGWLSTDLSNDTVFVIRVFTLVLKTNHHYGIEFGGCRKFIGTSNGCKRQHFIMVIWRISCTWHKPCMV